MMPNLVSYLPTSFWLFSLSLNTKLSFYSHDPHLAARNL